MSEDWISAREALEMLWPGCNGFSPSTEKAIIEYAAAERVRAKAASFTIEGQGRQASHEEHPIPRSFWQAARERQDWHHGIFIRVQRGTDLDTGMDWEIRCTALGVTFNGADIEAMAPKDMQARASSVHLPTMAVEQGLGKLPDKANASDKLPRLPAAALQRWWDGLSDAERDLPRDKLHKMCVAAHPANSIARERVRKISPIRKSGPRPIKPESAA